MKFFKRIGLILVIVFCLFSKKGFGQPSTLKIGCLVNNYVYFQYLGSNAPDGSYAFMGYSPYSSESDTPTRQLWDVTTQNQNNCYLFNPVGGTCSIRTTSSGSTYISGIRGRFTYTPTNCPIDDFIPYFIPLIGLLGFFYIKKYRLV